MKPDVSLFSSASRPQNWTALYESIDAGRVTFELVFVGPNEPHFELPENFRFIKSRVKPAQCFEIALRNCRADEVMYIADDCEFVTKRPLEKMLDYYSSADNSKNMISCRYMLDGKDQSDYVHRFLVEDQESPIMPLCGLASRQMLLELGGIDRNFIAVMWDLDIAMRIYGAGGRIILSDVYINEDKQKSAGSTLCADFWHHDRKLLEDLWMPEGRLLQERRRPARPFVDTGILDRSQGPRGRWRGQNPMILEMAADWLAGTWKSVRTWVGRLTRKFGEVARPLRRIDKYPYYFRKLLMNRKTSPRQP